MKIFKILILFCLLSCSKAKLETTYTTQEKEIDNFITTQLESHPEFIISRNNGANRLTILEGSGSDIQKKGNNIKFHYAGYVFTNSINTSNLFSTNHQETAQEALWEIDDIDYSAKVLKLTDENFVPGLLNGLIGVKAGEECFIIFSGKYGFGKKPLNKIPKNSALAYKIWVEEVNYKE